MGPCITHAIHKPQLFCAGKVLLLLLLLLLLLVRCCGS